MQARSLLDLVELLLGLGWHVRVGLPTAPLHGPVLDFPAVHSFAAHVRACESPAGQAWFLGSEDFGDNSGDGWNFLEARVSLASAAGDATWTAEVRAFWAEHLPFAVSSRGDYACLAIDRSGRIWTGMAPELEDVRLVAAGIDDFVAMFLQQARAKAGPLFDFWLRDA